MSRKTQNSVKGGNDLHKQEQIEASRTLIQSRKKDCIGEDSDNLEQFELIVDEFEESPYQDLQTFTLEWIDRNAEGFRDEKNEEKQRNLVSKR